MSGFIKEFKTFVMRGNILDLAVGIVIGAAFNKIVTSFVNDILMPPIGLALNKVDFKDLKVVLYPAEAGKDAVTINYGMFIQNLIDFIIIAFSVFLVMKAYNMLKRKEEAKPQPPPPPLTRTEELLTEIRNALNNRK